MALGWVLLMVGFVQATEAPVTATGRPSTPPPPSASAPNSVDEVVVTAPRQGKPAPPMYPVVSGERGRRIEAEGRRKDAMVLYRDNLWAPYPGLRCVFRAKTCPD